MKKTLLVVLLGSISTAAAFAQGAIFFDNRESVLGRSALVIDPTTGTGLVGENYVAQLYYAADAANPFATAAVTEGPSLFRLPTTAQPGTWNGGTRTLTTAGGNTVNLIVRVWDNLLYSSYGDALESGNANTLAGQSEVFSYTIPLSGDDVMNNFQGFSVAPVPEPSTIALGALGIGALLMVRRRK